MMVMVSNQSTLAFGCLAGAHPGKVGHLFSPEGQREPLKWMPYALDNGAYSAFTSQTEFDFSAWRELLRWAKSRNQQPIWAAVPDKVQDAQATLALWEQHHSEVRSLCRPCLVIQDGMTFGNVPDDECMLFLGGSTEWKESAIEPWSKQYPGRIHVGRVNDAKRLWKCHRAGVTSVDGTGWWHHRQLEILIEYCETSEWAAFPGWGEPKESTDWERGYSDDDNL